MPPARAIAIAISDSVTVSMAAETSGTWSVMPRVKRLAVLTSSDGPANAAGDEEHIVEGQRGIRADAICRESHPAI